MSPDQTEDKSDGAAVRLRRRSKSRKKRARRALEDEDGSFTGNEEDKEMTASELLLMRQAQKIRDETRKAALDITAGQKGNRNGQQSEQARTKSEDNVVNGLKDDFAVERSGHDMEERMEKYINEGMKQKFGDKEDYQEGSTSDRNASDEYDLFAVPERLRVEQRPQYDPGEGLPAAGVEEVELSEDARRKNIENTICAHKKLLQERKHLKVPVMESIPGNVSANYAKHRSDWMAQHLGPKGHERDDQSTKKASSRREDTAEKGRDEITKRPRYQAATDHLVADRFKKRWRR